jgi:hypothetical protein
MGRPISTVPGLLTLGLAACAPDPSGPVDALVADLTEEGYRPVVRSITTLGDPGDGDALEGRVARIRGLSEVALGVPVGTPSTLPAFRDAMILDAGEVVRPRWTTVGDALYPRDFDAFALTTVYHHVERAVLYYESVGAPLPDPVDVRYLGRLKVPGFEDTLELTDNALYFFGVRFLVVTRFELLQDVPLGMNRGVVVHEIGHAVFDELVYDDEARLRLLEGELADRTANLLRATTEGLSDYFAAAETGDPHFLDASVPKELLAFPRDVDQPVELTSGILGSADAAPAIYDPYLPGTCLASALWRLEPDRTAVAAALVGAQRALGERLRVEPPWDVPPEDFGFAWLLDPFVVALPEADRSGACAILVEQLPAATEYMEECR